MLTELGRKRNKISKKLNKEIENIKEKTRN